MNTSKLQKNVLKIYQIDVSKFKNNLNVYYLKKLKETIDSGDVFFIKYECDECLYLSQMIWCNLLQAYKQDQEYDSIGFAFRDQTGLYIISNQFGETKVMEYADFISQPFLSELSLRKLIIKNKKVVDPKFFFKLIQSHFLKINKPNQPKKKEYKISNKMQIKKLLNQKNRSSEQFAMNYLKALNIVSDQIVKSNIYPYISEYDNQKPFFFKSGYLFDSKIIIRSSTNRQLNSSNLQTSKASFDQ